MSSMKFAKGPLYAALSVGAVGVLLLLLPRFGVALPFEGDLVGSALGLLTLVLLVVSVVMGSRGVDDDDEALTEADLVPSVAFGPQGTLAQQAESMTPAERKAAKAAEKAAKKEAAERAKFEKKAMKEAEKAAKKAGKSNIVADDAAEWLGEIKQDFSPAADETSVFGTVSQPVFQPQPVAAPQAPTAPVFQPAPTAPQMTPIAVAASEMLVPSTSDNFGVPTTEVDMTDAAAATDAPMFTDQTDAPQWAVGAYEDPTFQVPFSDGASTVVEDAPIAEAASETAEVPVVVVAPPVEQEPEVVEVAPIAEVEVHEVDVEDVIIEPEAIEDPAEDISESVVVGQFPDIDTSLDEEVDDESITEVEERLERLASEVLSLIDNARGEVRTIRREGEATRRRHNEQVTALASALSDSRDEMTRLADELAEAGDHQKAALDAQSMLAQAQIENQKADLERQQAVARLRQVRVAILRKEPVDADLLAIVEKSLREMLGNEAATTSDSDTPQS